MSDCLGRDSLEQLPADVMLPAYDPDDHGPGIVHLGIGAFHRAHQAAYIDSLLAQEGGDWRIIGVSLRSPDVRGQLAPQDHLYSLVERGSGGDRVRIIGSVASVLVAPENPQAVIDAIADPRTHIVSLTVTEKGYCRHPAGGGLDFQHRDIVQDLEAGATPRSAIGYLAAGFAARRERSGTALTVLSCDNLPENGPALRSVLRDFVAQRDPALLSWMSANVRFPATMVDRIVPATTEADVERLESRLDMADRGMVKAEPFSQWVIEDDFAGPRPPFERVGVQLVEDVRPFELAKLRMLNGAHSTLAYLGLLERHETVDQAIGDPAIASVVERLMRKEAAATLPPAPGLDPDAYADALIERFANPALDHRLAQIAMDGSQKLPQRLLAVISDCQALGIIPHGAMLGVAGWIIHVRGAQLDGRTHPVDDPRAGEFAAIAGAARGDIVRLVDGLLAVEAIFGTLGDATWPRDALAERVEALLTRGVAGSVAPAG